MTDNRLIVRLEKYWQRLRKDDIMPDFKKNNPAMIEDLWSQCFVISIVPPDCAAYKYEYIGEKVREIYGRDLIGRTVDLKNMSFPNSVISPRLQAIKSLYDMKEPQEDVGQTPSIGGKFVKYRTILLPFGNEKAGVTHIIAGVSYREF